MQSRTSRNLVDFQLLTLLKGRSYEDEPNHPPRCTSAAIYGPSGYPAHLSTLHLLRDLELHKLPVSEQTTCSPSGKAGDLPDLSTSDVMSKFIGKNAMRD